MRIAASGLCSARGAGRRLGNDAMFYDSGQFGSWDGKDNRKTVMDLFVRMGHGLPEDIAGAKRAGFLAGLIALSGSFPGKPLRVTNCTAPEAYTLFVAITGVLGVSIDEAAEMLEESVRKLAWIGRGLAHKETSGYAGCPAIRGS